MKTTVTLHDFHPKPADLKREVLEGLASEPKHLPCKFLYDEKGSELFDQITKLDDYYPARTETAILENCIDEVAERIGPRAMVVEYGSGTSTKTPLLLNALYQPDAYVPIEISREYLIDSAERINEQFPSLDVIPICADYIESFEPPEDVLLHENRMVFFPGSTIGNFEPHEAIEFLGKMKRMVGSEGHLLLGVDLLKDPEVLIAAYNDSEGVTAEFNLNLLDRINRELGANFQRDQFYHQALFNEAKGRMELYLFSRRNQQVELFGQSFSLAADEGIYTESSYKYTFERFADVANAAGLEVEKVWTDERQWFSVQLLRSLD